MDAKWVLFKDEKPEVNRNITVDTTEEVYNTITYIHNGKLMVKLVDGNPFFCGYSPELLHKDAKWKYLN